MQIQKDPPTKETNQIPLTATNLFWFKTLAVLIVLSLIMSFMVTLMLMSMQTKAESNTIVTTPETTYISAEITQLKLAISQLKDLLDNGPSNPRFRGNEPPPNNNDSASVTEIYIPKLGTWCNHSSSEVRGLSRSRKRDLQTAINRIIVARNSRDNTTSTTLKVDGYAGDLTIDEFEKECTRELSIPSTSTTSFGHPSGGN